MASFPDATTTTDSESTTETTDTTTDGSTDTTTDESTEGTDGLLARLAERARTVADLLAPFTSLLTTVVQAATVWTLVRKA